MRLSIYWPLLEAAVDTALLAAPLAFFLRLSFLTLPPATPRGTGNLVASCAVAVMEGID